MKRRAFLSGTAGVGALGLAGCTGGIASTGVSEGSYDVGMASSAFLPTEFEATVGEPVIWKNTGSRAHTVTAYGGQLPDGAAYFASGGFGFEMAARRAYTGRLGGAIYSGESYTHTFEVPGTYGYFCIPHEPGGMIGRIVVRG